MTSPTSAKARPGRPAFTLIELLIVIGIITLLISILIPVVNSARRAGERAAIAGQLQSIGVALDQYKSDFGDYPRADNPDVQTGSDLLVRTLIAPFAVNGAGIPDGAEGPGFRVRKIGGTAQGRVYGPYISPDKFGIGVSVAGGGSFDVNKAAIPTSSPPASTSQLLTLLDRNGHPILYVPARPVKPDFSLANAYVGNTDAAYYDYRYVLDKVNSGADGWDPANVKAFAYLLGDTNGAQDGAIKSSDGETAATTAPYLLWSAGTDAQYGITDLTPGAAANCNDVTNFR